MTIGMLAVRTQEVCRKRGWYRDWSGGGCYLHLETSEFIEALRGKGDPVEEAADILFVFLSMLEEHGILIEEVMDRCEKACKDIEEGIRGVPAGQ